MIVDDEEDRNRSKNKKWLIPIIVIISMIVTVTTCAVFIIIGVYRHRKKKKVTDGQSASGQHCEMQGVSGDDADRTPLQQQQQQLREKQQSNTSTHTPSQFSEQADIIDSTNILVVDAQTQPGTSTGTVAGMATDPQEQEQEQTQKQSLDGDGQKEVEAENRNRHFKEELVATSRKPLKENTETDLDNSFYRNQHFKEELVDKGWKAPEAERSKSSKKGKKRRTRESDSDDGKVCVMERCEDRAAQIPPLSFSPFSQGSSSLSNSPKRISVRNEVSVAMVTAFDFDKERLLLEEENLEDNGRKEQETNSDKSFKIRKEKKVEDGDSDSGETKSHNVKLNQTGAKEVPTRNDMLTAVEIETGFDINKEKLLLDEEDLENRKAQEGKGEPSKKKKKGDGGRSGGGGNGSCRKETRIRSAVFITDTKTIPVIDDMSTAVEIETGFDFNKQKRKGQLSKKGKKKKKKNTEDDQSGGQGGGGGGDGDGDGGSRGRIKFRNATFPTNTNTVPVRNDMSAAVEVETGFNLNKEIFILDEEDLPTEQFDGDGK